MYVASSYNVVYRKKEEENATLGFWPFLGMSIRYLSVKSLAEHDGDG